jgi:hypothetical protein
MQDRHRQFDEIFLQRTAGPYIGSAMLCAFFWNRRKAARRRAEVATAGPNRAGGITHPRRG